MDQKREENSLIVFYFLPETIGSIAYLSKNYKYLKKNIVAGYVLTCVGDNRNYSMLRI